jgi:hypothetical protein
MGQAKKFPVKRKQTADQFRKDALRRLRERWEEDHENEEWEPGKEAVVTPMLKAVEGGTGRVIQALRAHTDDDAQAFIELYDSLSAADRKHVSVEVVAFACGIGSLRLVEVAQTALFLYASIETKMLISSSMPKVTRSIIKAATDEVPITAYNSDTGMQEVVGKTNGDVKAMELFGRISGIAPVPKGATIAIQNNYGDRDDKPAVTTAGWRTPEERLREIQDMTEPKRLPSPAAVPISIGGHIDHMQAQTVEILRGE